MKRPLPYSYHFNFGTSRTQEHIKPRLITSYMDGAHNLPPNKRTCSRKEINALQAEDIIPHCNPTNKQPHNAPIKQEDHTGEIIPFNRTSSTSTILNALCLIWTTNKQKGLLFALYRIIRRQAAQHTTKETRRAHTANK